MKRGLAISAVLLSAALSLLLYSSAGYAQTSHHSALTVKIPFEFVVGNQTFPAGIYKFQSLLNSDPRKAAIDVLEVRSTEGWQYKAIVTDVVGGTEPNQGKLVFTRNGDRTFLSEVWEPGKQAGCRLQRRDDHTQTAGSENDEVVLIASAGER